MVLEGDGAAEVQNRVEMDVPKDLLAELGSIQGR